MIKYVKDNWEFWITKLIEKGYIKINTKTIVNNKKWDHLDYLIDKIKLDNFYILKTVLKTKKFIKYFKIIKVDTDDLHKLLSLTTQYKNFLLIINEIGVNLDLDKYIPEQNIYNYDKTIIEYIFEYDFPNKYMLLEQYNKNFINLKNFQANDLYIIEKIFNEKYCIINNLHDFDIYQKYQNLNLIEYKMKIGEYNLLDYLQTYFKDDKNPWFLTSNKWINNLFNMVTNHYIREGMQYNYNIKNYEQNYIDILNYLLNIINVDLVNEKLMKFGITDFTIKMIKIIINHERIPNEFKLYLNKFLIIPVKYFPHNNEGWSTPLTPVEQKQLIKIKDDYYLWKNNYLNIPIRSELNFCPSYSF